MDITSDMARYNRANKPKQDKIIIIKTIINMRTVNALQWFLALIFNISTLALAFKL